MTTGTTMLDDFLVRAALAGVGAAVAAGLLGCFVVWRRMAYFGDATSHAALLGVALALAFDMSVTAGILGVTGTLAIVLWAATARDVAQDALLGVLAHGALAAGLVAVALVPGAGGRLDAYLFGDVLTVTRSGLAVIWIGAATVAGVLAWRWQRMLVATIDADLALAAGGDPRREQLILTLMLAGVVTMAIQVTGALLITVLLVIPAATARRLSRGPEVMAVWAVAIGAGSALGGLWIAVLADTPVGPTMICVAAGAFAVSRLAPTRAG